MTRDCIKALEFTTRLWPEAVSTVAASFRFSAEEREALKRNATARLIAAIPFLAGCDQPMRTAVSHLAVYHMARAEAKKLFQHHSEDDAGLMLRLERISHFPGGDSDVVNKGMALLALQMLRNHGKDIAADYAAGKYNPVSSGEWEFGKLEAGLIERINAVESPELDKIFTIQDARGFWDDNEKP